MIKTLLHKSTYLGRLALGIVFVSALIGFAGASQAAAQSRLPDLGRLGDLGRIGDAVNVQIKLGEITLESIDFRNQTATLNLGLDVANGILPVNLKDFDYRLRLAERDVIEGSHAGTLKIGGRRRRA